VYKSSQQSNFLCAVNIVVAYRTVNGVCFVVVYLYNLFSELAEKHILNVFSEVCLHQLQYQCSCVHLRNTHAR
jgi:hypothetical protein